MYQRLNPPRHTRRLWVIVVLLTLLYLSATGVAVWRDTVAHQYTFIAVLAGFSVLIPIGASALWCAERDLAQQELLHSSGVIVM